MSKTDSAAKWFKQPEKKESRKREPLPAAFLDRLLNYDNEIRQKRYMKGLYIGHIGEIKTAEDMGSKLKDFWEPPKEEFSYNFEFYMDIGTFLGNVLARRLHKIPNLTYCDKDTHEEYKIVNEEFGYAGRPDLILDVLLYEYLGKKTTPKEPPTEVLFRPFEAKTTSKRNYDLWITSSDFPYKYRCQLSLCIHNLMKDGIVKDDEGYFILQARDAPNFKRVCHYKMERKVVEDAHDTCLKFWNHVQNRDGFGITKDWVEDMIAKQPNRIWNPLAKV